MSLSVLLYLFLYIYICMRTILDQGIYNSSSKIWYTEKVSAYGGTFILRKYTYLSIHLSIFLSSCSGISSWDLDIMIVCVFSDKWKMERSIEWHCTLCIFSTFQHFFPEKQSFFLTEIVHISLCEKKHVQVSIYIPNLSRYQQLILSARSIIKYLIS